MAIASPSDLSGLVLWLNASAISPQTDDTEIGTWNDDSGQANHVSQGTAPFRPRLRTNVVNGKSVARFSGTTQWLTATDSASLSVGELTLCLVCKPTGVADSTGAILRKDLSYQLYAKGEPASDVYHAALGNTTPGWAWRDLGYAVQRNVWQLLTLRYKSSNGDLRFRFNGSQKHGTVETGALADNANGLGVGGSFDGSYSIAMDLAELCLYNRPLTDVEMGDLEQYLATRYGIGGVAPIGIPQVQKKTGFSANGASVTATFDATPTQGSLLVACYHNKDHLPATPSGWTKAAEATSFGAATLFYKIAGASEPAAVTVADGTSTAYQTLTIFEYSGIDATPLDKTATASSGGSTVTTQSTGTTAATAQADELLIALVGMEYNTDVIADVWTNTFGLESSVANNSANEEGSVTGSRIVSATGTYETTASTFNARAEGVIATFKMAAVAGAPAEHRTKRGVGK